MNRYRRDLRRSKAHPDGCSVCRPSDPCSRPVAPEQPVDVKGLMRAMLNMVGAKTPTTHAFRSGRF